MRDVAALADVSVATVSRVVNGGDVRGDLVLRVRDAVDVLGYRRDVTASTLRRADRLSATIGLIIEDVGNPFFSAVQRGVEDVARGRGVIAFAGSSDEDGGREMELAEALTARGVDGLVIVPCATSQTYLARDRDAGLALVFVDRPPRFLDADAVVSDNAGGAATAVAHLIDQGHRRIAYLGDRHTVWTAAERRRGYRDALTGRGVLRAPELERVELASSTAAAAAARELLLGPAPPTALFSAQNLITIGAIHALRELGMRHDVALVGFDDVPLSDTLEPAVTVVAQDPRAIGRRGAELLFDRLDGSAAPTRRVVVPTRLIARGSGEIRPRAVSDVPA